MHFWLVFAGAEKVAANFRLHQETSAARESGTTMPASGTPHALIMSLRPHQWVKNTLVFGGLVFSHSLFDWTAIWHSLGAFAAFCLASSGVYLLNDLQDLEQDRRHPTKRLRPLAAGMVPPITAGATMVVLLLGSTAGGFLLGPQFAVILSVYILMNIVYSLSLKRVVIVDVMVIAIGFVLRAVAGAVVIGVSASPWLILCTFMLALLVGLGKRRHELSLLGTGAQEHRTSLEDYSVQFLDMLMGIAGATAVVTYSLYTLAEETVSRFGSSHIVFTTPFVVYGVFRYLYLTHQHKEAGDPARLFLTDVPTLLNLLLWASMVCVIIYWPL